MFYVQHTSTRVKDWSNSKLKKLTIYSFYYRGYSIPVTLLKYSILVFVPYHVSFDTNDRLILKNCGVEFNGLIEDSPGVRKSLKENVRTCSNVPSNTIRFVF